MLKEFKQFALRGNVVDMAVGIVIGAAFGAIVQSLVKDVLMPPLGLFTGGVDLTDRYLLLGGDGASYATLAEAQEAGAVTLNYGLFINSIIDFVIIAFAIFLVVRWMNEMNRAPEKPVEAPTTKNCTFCTEDIPIKATRCPRCTSELVAA